MFIKKKKNLFILIWDVLKLSASYTDIPGVGSIARAMDLKKGPKSPPCHWTQGRPCQRGSQSGRRQSSYQITVLICYFCVPGPQVLTGNTLQLTFQRPERHSHKITSLRPSSGPVPVTLPARLVFGEHINCISPVHYYTNQMATITVSFLF